MNVARIGLLAVALGAAGGAAFLVSTLSGGDEVPATAPVAELPKTEILVASRPIEAGAVVAPGDLRWQSWPAEGVSPGFLTRAAVPAAGEDMTGSMVRSALEQGEPVTRSKVVKVGEAGFMAAMLNPGMRAIAIKITEETGAAGFILPNDRVDVILTRKLEGDMEGGSGGQKHDSQTILQNIRVLAIGQTYKEGENERTVQGKTATLELTPSQTELLALAGAMGDVTLSLRSVAGGDMTAAVAGDDGLMRGPADGAIRVVRYARGGRAVPASISQGGTSK